MNSLPSLVPLLIAFILGLLVGRYFRFGDSSTKFSFTGSADVSTPGREIRINTTSTNLTLKCMCGATHKFHKGSGSAESGSEPYPEGDSYTCNSCGKIINLAEIRKLAGKSGSQF